MTKFLETAQWNSGTKVADCLDVFFRARGWAVAPTTLHEEIDLCLGDRHFIKNGVHYLVEYKSGIQTFHTGNVFLETISVDRDNRPGWVYTCKSDLIMYAALLNYKILVFIPDSLRVKIDDLKTKFREVPTKNHQNEDYKTWGLVVPFDYAVKHLSSRVITITEQDQ